MTVTNLADGGVSLGLPLGGGVQTPEGGETTAAFTGRTRHRLVPPPDAAFRTGRHL